SLAHLHVNPAHKTPPVLSRLSKSGGGRAVFCLLRRIRGYFSAWLAKFSTHDFYFPASSGNGELMCFVGGSVSPHEYLKLHMPPWRGVMLPKAWQPKAM